MAQGLPTIASSPVTVEPAETVFRDVRIGSHYEREVYLRNHLDATLEVSLRSSSGDRYAVSPSHLRLPPQGTAAVRLSLRVPQFADLKRAHTNGQRDTFLIKSAYFEKLFYVRFFLEAPHREPASGAADLTEAGTEWGASSSKSENLLTGSLHNLRRSQKQRGRCSPIPGPQSGERAGKTGRQIAHTDQQASASGLRYKVVPGTEEGATPPSERVGLSLPRPGAQREMVASGHPHEDCQDGREQSAENVPDATQDEHNVLGGGARAPLDSTEEAPQGQPSGSQQPSMVQGATGDVRGHTVCATETSHGAEQEVIGLRREYEAMQERFERRVVELEATMRDADRKIHFLERDNAHLSSTVEERTEQLSVLMETMEAVKLDNKLRSSAEHTSCEIHATLDGDEMPTERRCIALTAQLATAKSVEGALTRRVEDWKAACEDYQQDAAASKASLARLSKQFEDSLAQQNVALASAESSRRDLETWKDRVAKLDSLMLHEQKESYVKSQEITRLQAEIQALRDASSAQMLRHHEELEWQRKTVVDDFRAAATSVETAKKNASPAYLLTAKEQARHQTANLRKALLRLEQENISFKQELKWTRSTLSDLTRKLDDANTRAEVAEHKVHEFENLQTATHCLVGERLAAQNRFKQQQIMELNAELEHAHASIRSLEAQALNAKAANERQELLVNSLTRELQLVKAQTSEHSYDVDSTQYDRVLENRLMAILLEKNMDAKVTNLTKELVTAKEGQRHAQKALERTYKEVDIHMTAVAKLKRTVKEFEDRERGQIQDWAESRNIRTGSPQDSASRVQRLRTGALEEMSIRCKELENELQVANLKIASLQEKARQGITDTKATEQSEDEGLNETGKADPASHEQFQQARERNAMKQLRGELSTVMQENRNLHVKLSAFENAAASLRIGNASEEDTADDVERTLEAFEEPWRDIAQESVDNTPAGVASKFHALKMYALDMQRRLRLVCRVEVDLRAKIRAKDGRIRELKKLVQLGRHRRPHLTENMGDMRLQRQDDPPEPIDDANSNARRSAIEESGMSVQRVGEATEEDGNESRQQLQSTEALNIVDGEANASPRVRKSMVIGDLASRLATALKDKKELILERDQLQASLDRLTLVKEQDCQTASSRMDNGCRRAHGGHFLPAIQNKPCKRKPGDHRAKLSSKGGGTSYVAHSSTTGAKCDLRAHNNTGHGELKGLLDSFLMQLQSLQAMVCNVEDESCQALLLSMSLPESMISGEDTGMDESAAFLGKAVSQAIDSDKQVGVVEVALQVERVQKSAVHSRRQVQCVMDALHAMADVVMGLQAQELGLPGKRLAAMKPTMSRGTSTEPNSWSRSTAVMAIMPTASRGVSCSSGTEGKAKEVVQLLQHMRQEHQNYRSAAAKKEACLIKKCTELERSNRSLTDRYRRRGKELETVKSELRKRMGMQEYTLLDRNNASNGRSQDARTFARKQTSKDRATAYRLVSDRLAERKRDRGFIMTVEATREDNVAGDEEQQAKLTDECHKRDLARGKPATANEFLASQTQADLLDLFARVDKAHKKLIDHQQQIRSQSVIDSLDRITGLNHHVKILEGELAVIGDGMKTMSTQVDNVLALTAKSDSELVQSLREQIRHWERKYIDLEESVCKTKENEARVLVERLDALHTLHESEKEGLAAHLLNDLNVQRSDMEQARRQLERAIDQERKQFTRSADRMMTELKIAKDDAQHAQEEAAQANQHLKAMEDKHSQTLKGIGEDVALIKVSFEHQLRAVHGQIAQLNVSSDLIGNPSLRHGGRGSPFSAQELMPSLARALDEMRQLKTEFSVSALHGFAEERVESAIRERIKEKVLQVQGLARSLEEEQDDHHSTRTKLSETARELKKTKQELSTALEQLQGKESQQRRCSELEEEVSCLRERVKESATALRQAKSQISRQSKILHSRGRTLARENGTIRKEERDVATDEELRKVKLEVHRKSRVIKDLLRKVEEREEQQAVIEGLEKRLRTMQMAFSSKDTVHRTVQDPSEERTQREGTLLGQETNKTQDPQGKSMGNVEAELCQKDTALHVANEQVRR
eukprot:scaffold996_cov409-Prasinococcus_capsulatus_cf.AAC.23